MEFKNGFESWYETFFDVSAFITLILAKDDPYGVILETEESAGTGGIYDLARKWTDEFEELYSPEDWDGEYFDVIEQFLINNNNNKH